MTTITSSINTNSAQDETPEVVEIKLSDELISKIKQCQSAIAEMGLFKVEFIIPAPKWLTYDDEGESSITGSDDKFNSVTMESSSIDVFDTYFRVTGLPKGGLDSDICESQDITLSELENVGQILMGLSS